jgi:hypothetical protein
VHNVESSLGNRLWTYFRRVRIDSREAPINLVKSVRPSIFLSLRPSACISAALTERIFVKFDTEIFMKICQGTQNIFKIGQKYRPLYMKPYLRFVVAGGINSS